MIETGDKLNQFHMLNLAALLLTYFIHASYLRTVYMYPIHAAAMFNRMRGLEGKYARHYVNRDVTLLLLHALSHSA